MRRGTRSSITSPRPNEPASAPEELDRLVALTRAEFPRDEMMVELHVLRTL
jgi:hypothetical protein